MIKLFRHHVSVGSVLVLTADTLLLLAAVPLAVAMQAGGRQSAETLLPALVFTGLMLALNGSLGLYRREGGAGFGGHLGRVLLAVAIGIPVAYMLFSVTPHGYEARSAIGYTVVLTLCGLILLRQVVFWANTAGLGAKRVLIVGTGEDAAGVERALATLGYPSMAIVGFYPVSQGAESPAVPADRILPTALPLSEVVGGLGVKEVIVAVREQRGGVLPMRELIECRVSGVPVTDLAGVYERVRGEVPVDSLKASWLIYGQGFAQGGLRTFVKRSFDIVVSAAMLVLTLPLMLVTALAIRLDSPGPVIFRQVRVGRGGRAFTCLKFRSMRADAEADGKPRWAVADDERVTRLGRFIRKTRIDELPQLINVLRGDMSFVGPRPERPLFVNELKQTIPYYDLRHSVNPGITGWAQVRYSYGASVEDARKKLQFDLYYVKNHSLFLDLLILVETVRVVLFREGAH
ncbi:MAG: TIGR03013 family PEP-CTERM/XrtA system glycosyltransferase [Burkholderiaceae bacterium]|jgi:sugar transferase (PEP-CTERM system associated)|nr:TIGR03013 family PEP-CTERM/XrtA system glycosyltransferase [Burkholderiaceae bacterium]